VGSSPSVSSNRTGRTPKPERRTYLLNDPYEKRGDCYLKTGDYRRAELDFNRIVKGIPDFGKSLQRWRSMGGKFGEEWFIDIKSTEFGETPRLWAKFMEKDQSHIVQSFDFDCKVRRITMTSLRSTTRTKN
jgi:hypothetical protein